MPESFPLMDQFGSVTSCAQINVVGDKLDQLWPVELVLDVVDCFSDTRVPCEVGDHGVTEGHPTKHLGDQGHTKLLCKAGSPPS